HGDTGRIRLVDDRSAHVDGDSRTTADLRSQGPLKNITASSAEVLVRQFEIVQSQVARQKEDDFFSGRAGEAADRIDDRRCRETRGENAVLFLEAQGAVDLRLALGALQSAEWPICGESGDATLPRTNHSLQH